MCGCTIVDLSTHIMVTDGLNQNLLDPETPGYLKEEDIRIYYLNDGKREEVYRPSMDAPRNFRITKDNPRGEYEMILYPDEGRHDGEVTTTIIHWNDDVEEDILECEVHRWSSSVSITKIWTGGTLVYDKTNPSDTPDNVGGLRLVRLIK